MVAARPLGPARRRPESRPFVHLTCSAPSSGPAPAPICPWFETTVDEDLERVASGGAVFKAVRGEYGSGKTFFARWLQERARRRGMAAAEVPISENETPLHRLESVYRG